MQPLGSVIFSISLLFAYNRELWKQSGSTSELLKYYAKGTSILALLE